MISFFRRPSLSTSGKTERPMSDIGLSRLAETFSLKVTVLTPVTDACGGILSTSRSASIKQNDCLLSEMIFILRMLPDVWATYARDARLSARKYTRTRHLAGLQRR
jgi:hypothetical protein